MARRLYRIQPTTPVQAMQTFQVATPPTTHTRPASCWEVECEPFKNGWITRVPAGSDLETLVRRQGRKWSGAYRDGAEMVFQFAPETPCFKADTHVVSLERPAFYIVRGGDWRANTGLIRRHTRGEDWVEHMQESLDSLGGRGA
jgi:hypothetical protein